MKNVKLEKGNNLAIIYLKWLIYSDCMFNAFFLPITLNQYYKNFQPSCFIFIATSESLATKFYF